MKHSKMTNDSSRSDSSRSDSSRTIDAEQITRAHAGAAQLVPLETRSLLEPLFGHSFADVRVFSDSNAAQTAEDLHAKAFTIGQNISFADGHYQPESPRGQRLLAHELAHTIQQGRVGTLPRSLEVSRAGDAGEQGADALVSSLGTGNRPSVSGLTSPAVQCEDAAAPSVDWSLDPRNPHAQASLPIGSGTGTATVNTTAASLQLQTPDLTAQAGYDWQRGLNADMKYHLDPATISAQASPSGVAGQFQMPNLQLNGGYMNGAPYANGQGQVGPFQAQAAYDPSKGFTAQGSAVWPGGSGYLGTSGAGVQQQVGPVTTGINTDFNRVNAFATGATDIAGLPLDLRANAGIGVNGDDPTLGARLTLPNLVNVGGVTASPYVGADISSAGVNPSAGLGISGNLPELPF